MKYTLFVTQQCNLRCSYCYIVKRDSQMSLSVAKKVIDLVYERTPPQENIDIGFFGGEPLLAFETIKSITDIIESHQLFDPGRVKLAIVFERYFFLRQDSRFY